MAFASVISRWSSWWAVLAAGAASSAALLVGCARCPYESRCNGNVLEVCTVGVDQMFGDPSYASTPCEGVNPVCVDAPSGRSLCARAASAPCADASVTRCDTPDVAVRCEEGFEVAEDCATDENSCVTLPSRSRCARAPVTTCDVERQASVCEDATHLLSCVDGLLTRRDCSLRAGDCTPAPNGSTAYCSQ